MSHCMAKIEKVEWAMSDVRVELLLGRDHSAGTVESGEGAVNTPRVYLTCRQLNPRMLRLSETVLKPLPSVSWRIEGSLVPQFP